MLYRFCQPAELTFHVEAESRQEAERRAAQVVARMSAEGGDVVPTEKTAQLAGSLMAGRVWVDENATRLRLEQAGVPQSSRGPQRPKSRRFLRQNSMREP